MLPKIILAACLAISIQSQAQIDPAKIDIIRDKYGVPHIFGKTDPEVAYGLAWAHAEDDFTTIQQSLLAGKAMMAQYQGKKGASIDYIVHLLRIPELVEERYESDLAPDFKKLLEGYSAGLNAYAAKHPKEVLLKKIFPVTPKDMVQYSVLQLCVLSGADKALAAIFGGTVPLLENYKTQGSNAFAFNSNKTTDGNVYLAINAHQPLEGPVAFYEAHLSSEEGWNILGANFPGAPSILHGVNEYLGWAHTVNDPDKLDVYQLEINPENKTQYKFDGKWETLEEKVAPLKVKIAGLKINVKKKAYWSKYGPTIITDRGTFSIRMPAQMDIRGLEQWYRFNKAKNFTEFKAALNMKAIPGYNIVYADKYDSIYYISNGRIPIRDKNYNWKTTLPGNTSTTLWNQLHPIEALPQVLQPKSGFVYNTNHSPFHSTEGPENPKVTDITMGYETLENNRSKRFEEMLKPLNKVNYEDFKRIKFSRQFPSNFYFPYNIDTLFMLDEKKYTDIADLISNLKSWNKIADAESIGAGTFFMITHTVYDNRALYLKQKTITENQSVEILRAAKNKMLAGFNRTNLQLGDIQKLVRGNVALPLPGLPDVLAPMYSLPYKDGMYKGNQGDAYIELVRFTKDGPIIESINVYGASARKDSPHYTDQMEMYVKQQTKKMTLDKATVYQQAVKKYNPL
ncbi:MAG TPA: penicillin acylase family protein [Sediminibacterium sp.]|uniref:penicillin acylase family protein n=1 Tax=Sediminibacterium sp. TaxID=1917865 RepID=UPI0008AF00C5|nr:penicillin acylase family protein [Sediminibacterium sp.]OHC85732.1 MAG: peptidase S45 [Sphingobacteriia bacterium RIFOXYC2_FULL_35_18]OHC87268.1 MAG: peptidase S45 [Sphingobacteriia bacterium RIFOXYD2_FULL_35_12]HLD52623.1 penicillin acylase family protein [Sediminibacterium sp.]